MRYHSIGWVNNITKRSQGLLTILGIRLDWGRSSTILLRADCGSGLRALQLRRAQSTASDTSLSDKPRPASLWRTASACVRRTGVSTMRPLSSVTSKHSTPGKFDKMLSGRVSRLLKDSLASKYPVSLSSRLANTEEAYDTTHDWLAYAPKSVPRTSSLLTPK